MVGGDSTHAHRDIKDVVARVAAFKEATTDDRLEALATLKSRAAASESTAAVTTLALVVPGLTLLGTGFFSIQGLYVQQQVAAASILAATSSADIDPKQTLLSARDIALEIGQPSQSVPILAVVCGTILVVALLLLAFLAVRERRFAVATTWLYLYRDATLPDEAVSSRQAMKPLRKGLFRRKSGRKSLAFQRK